MILTRAIRYASIQARLRARIGRLPDAAAWGILAAHPNQDLLAGLDGGGVDFWLEGLASGASVDALERHFMGRMRHLLRCVAGWLPDEWERFGDCLVVAPDIFWLKPVLDGEDPGTRLDRDSELQALIRAAPPQRLALAEKSRVGRYLDGGSRPEAQWRTDLLDRIPVIPRAERRPVERLSRILDEYLDAKDRVFQKLAEGNDSGEAPDESGSWQTHAMLERRLRLLLAGDSFNAALILVYGLLELLTMEKLRALLICRLTGWPPPAALAEAA